MEFFTLFVVLLLLLMAGVMLNRRSRRSRALATAFPAGWLATIRRNIPPYSKLSPEMQQQVQDYTREFLYDKNFEGCGGLVLDDEIKVTIAAQASLLLLNRKVRCYPRLYSVLVYPSTYVVKGGVDEESVRLGESWQTGSVVLAWDSVRRGSANFSFTSRISSRRIERILSREAKIARYSVIWTESPSSSSAILPRSRPVSW